MKTSRQTIPATTCLSNLEDRIKRSSPQLESYVNDWLLTGMPINKSTTSLITFFGNVEGFSSERLYLYQKSKNMPVIEPEYINRSVFNQMLKYKEYISEYFARYKTRGNKVYVAGKVTEGLYSANRLDYKYKLAFLKSKEKLVQQGYHPEQIILPTEKISLHNELSYFQIMTILIKLIINEVCEIHLIPEAEQSVGAQFEIMAGEIFNIDIKTIDIDVSKFYVPNDRGISHTRARLMLGVTPIEYRQIVSDLNISFLELVTKQHYEKMSNYLEAV